MAEILRITEDGETRITEDGENRVTEDSTEGVSVMTTLTHLTGDGYVTWGNKKIINVPKPRR